MGLAQISLPKFVTRLHKLHMLHESVLQDLATCVAWRDLARSDSCD
jgi:hypothetical protein